MKSKPKLRWEKLPIHKVRIHWQLWADNKCIAAMRYKQAKAIAGRKIPPLPKRGK